MFNRKLVNKVDNLASDIYEMWRCVKYVFPHELAGLECRIKRLECQIRNKETYSYDQIDHTPEYERAQLHGIIIFEANGMRTFLPMYKEGPDPVLYPQVGTARYG